MKYWWVCLTTNFANFEGRARREEVWMFWLFNLLFSFVPIFNFVLFFWSIIPGLAVAVRRLHDTGRSGWWYLICLLPIIGWIWFFILVYCIDSQPGVNKWGVNPKEMGGYNPYGGGYVAQQPYAQPSYTQPVTPPQVAPTTDVQYFVYVNGQQYGPYAYVQMQQYVQQGFVNAQTMVWKQGMAQWAPLAAVPELSQLLGR